MLPAVALLTIAFGQVQDAQPAAKADLKAKIKAYYESVEPIQFTTSIVHTGPPWRMFDGDSSSFTVLTTYFVSTRQFRIDRRDLYANPNGTVVSRSAVLWAKDGKVWSWSRDGDFGRGVVTAVSPHEEAEKTRGLIPSAWDVFLPTYQHKVLFGRLDWLTTDWRASDGLLQVTQGSMPSRKIRLIHNGYRFSGEEMRLMPMNRAQTDGSTTTVRHIAWQPLRDPDRATAFTPPK